MSIDFIRPEVDELRPRISVIGVGGAGGNAVNNMIEKLLEVYVDPAIVTLPRVSMTPMARPCRLRARSRTLGAAR